MASPKRPPGALETAVSVTVLLALAAIAATIVLRQVGYTSAFLSALDSTAATQPGPEPQIDLSACASEGFAPMSPAESFAPDELYNKIDGRDVLYLTAGFVALRCQRFADPADRDSWMEVYAYDMGNADNAFTVYSKQKRTEVTELAPLAYQTTNSLCFVHGRYYVEIVSSASGDVMRGALRACREKFIASVEAGTGPAIDDAALFPPRGLRAGSVSRAAAEDFGVPGFDGAFLAAFEVDGVTVMAFLVRRPSPEGATQAAAAYCEALRSFGASIEPAPAELPGGSVITILDTTKVVFARGPFVAGVHESPNRSAAIRVARQLYEALAEASR